jgi:hypothetical protein
MSDTENVDRLLASDSETPLRGPSASGFSMEQFVQILDYKLDQKLASFKRSFEDRDEQHQSQIKKLKTESKAVGSFKFKGNKIQFEFNSSVLDSLDLVSKSILAGDLTKTNTELEKLKKDVQKRNKLIRFADKSPAGWSAVEEYESDELAEDSDDEKKLRSAEKRAMVKLKEAKEAKKSAKGECSRQSYKPQFRSESTSSSQPFRLQPFRSSFCSGPRQPQPNDKCFSCGQHGHWAGSSVCANKYRDQGRSTSASGTSV